MLLIDMLFVWSLLFMTHAVKLVPCCVGGDVMPAMPGALVSRLVGGPTGGGDAEDGKLHTT